MAGGPPSLSSSAICCCCRGGSCLPPVRRLGVLRGDLPVRALAGVGGVGLWLAGGGAWSAG